MPQARQAKQYAGPVRNPVTPQRSRRPTHQIATSRRVCTHTGEEDGGEAGLLDRVVGGEGDSQLVAVGRDGLRQRRAAERAVHLASITRIAIAAAAAAAAVVLLILASVVESAAQHHRVVLAVLL